MIPKPRRDEQGKVLGEFYPLQKQELLALKRAKLINNSAYVHLALRYEYPYCNHIIDIVPKEFGLRWGIPESSVYEAIAKLRESKVFQIRTGRISIEWSDTEDSQQANNSENPESTRNSRKSRKPNSSNSLATYSQQANNSGNPELDRNSRINQKPCSSRSLEVCAATDSQQAGNSGNPENILEIQNQFQNPRIISELPENQSPKAFQGKDSSVSKISINSKKSKNTLSLESNNPKKHIEASTVQQREKLSLFEEWKKTATPGEAEDFEQFVRGERRKAGALDIMHFPSFMGDKYFPEWLKKWQAKKAKNSGSKLAGHYETWPQAQHREVAREYVIDPVTWMKQESWRVRWVEFVADRYPSVFTEVWREQQQQRQEAQAPGSEPIDDLDEDAKNLSDRRALAQLEESDPPNCPAPPKPTYALKRKLPDIAPAPEVRNARRQEQLACSSPRRKRQVQDG